MEFDIVSLSRAAETELSHFAKPSFCFESLSRFVVKPSQIITNMLAVDGCLRLSNDDLPRVDASLSHDIAKGCHGFESLSFPFVNQSLHIEGSSIVFEMETLFNSHTSEDNETPSIVIAKLSIRIRKVDNPTILSIGHSDAFFPGWEARPLCIMPCAINPLET